MHIVLGADFLPFLLCKDIRYVANSSDKTYLLIRQQHRCFSRKQPFKTSGHTFPRCQLFFGRLRPEVPVYRAAKSMMLFTQKIFINQFSLQSLQATGHLTCPGSPVLACFLPGSALSQSLQQFGYAVPDPERTYSREPVLWNPSHLLMPHSKHSR